MVRIYMYPQYITYMAIEDNSESCDRCRSSALVTDIESGETFCSKCGYVVTEKIQASGPEWRTFAQDDRGNKARAGAPTSLSMYDMGLATVINPANKDASGRPLTNSMKNTIDRLRTWDNRSQVHEPMDRNFRQAFGELNRLKDKLALSDAVIEKAAYIYRKALDKGLVRGRSISALMASSLFAACRNTRTARNIKDVEAASNVKRKDIARCYRLLLKELDLRMPVPDPIQCVARIASRIGVSEKTKRYAIQVLQLAQTKEISAGKDPMGLAAAALYLASVNNEEKLTQKDIAVAASVTEVTIRNRCKGLKDYLDV